MDRGEGLTAARGAPSQLVARRSRPPRVAGLLTGAAYVLAYLYSVQNIVVTPGRPAIAGADTPSVIVVGDWSVQMWKSIAPFVWEPIVAVHLLPSLAVLLSPLNLFVALVLGALVALNVAVAVERVRRAGSARRRTGAVKGVIGAAPGLLTGFTCCVPTVVLALGSLAAGFTVAVIAVRPYFIPAAALALALNLVWGARRLRCELGAAQGPPGTMK